MHLSEIQEISGLANASGKSTEKWTLTGEGGGVKTPASCQNGRQTPCHSSEFSLYILYSGARS